MRTDTVESGDPSDGAIESRENGERTDAQTVRVRGALDSSYDIDVCDLVYE